MKDFLKIQYLSKAELVVDKITNSIVNGERLDGELLPTENQLCHMFGVSRSILREAMRVLSSKGLVEIRQGHGTYVRLPKVEIPEEAVMNFLKANAFSLGQLIEIRTPLEIEVARLAAERRGDTHLEKISQSFEIIAMESSNVETYADADEMFHQVLIDASGNPLFGIMIHSIMVNLHIMRQLVIRTFGLEDMILEHQNIFEAIKHKKPSRAAAMMKEHMDGAHRRINKARELLKT